MKLTFLIASILICWFLNGWKFTMVLTGILIPTLAIYCFVIEWFKQKENKIDKNWVERN